MIMIMIEVMTAGAFAIVGLMMGSFAGASVWRLRARQLAEDMAAGEKVSAREYKKLRILNETNVRDDRSQCLHCHHRLAWYDLIPLFSWVMLGGRCRYCRASIGWFEPLMEIATASLFVVSYLVMGLDVTTPIGWLHVVLWCSVGVGLMILLAYDLRWFLLPDKVVFPLIGLGLVNVILVVSTSAQPLSALLSVSGAIAILSGLYLTLYILSRGAWIGFGDVKLGLLLALMLADWRLALLALLLANVIGCIVVLPGMLTKRLTRTSHVPFGPMLIGGFWIAGLFGTAILDWYLSISLMSL